MGTNYYARIIPKVEDKQKLKSAIDSNDYNTIEEMVKDMYSLLDGYTHTGGKIHLGKSSCGWKFLWNPNLHRYYDGYQNENNELKPVYRHWSPYELTKEGITQFVMRNDVEIYDEYDELQNKKDFLNYAFNKEGIDYAEYCSQEHELWYGDSEERLKPFKELGFNPEYGEFYSDGLRFSTSIDFC